LIPDFEITVLGNTSSIPVHGRNHTAQILRFGQDFLLLDCGEGMQIQARKYKIKISRINHIFISHLHGDHYLGLVGLLSSYHLAKRQTPLTIFGPRGLDEIITTHFRWSDTKIEYQINFVQTKTDEMNLLLDENLFQVYSFPLKHRIPTTGFLIREKFGLRSLVKEKIEKKELSIEGIKSLRSGIDYYSQEGEIFKVREYTYPLPPLRSYAFCSDTIFDPSLKDYIGRIDLLYHESTFMEQDRERAGLTFHSTAKQAGEIAKLCGAKKLLLGHFSSRYAKLEGLLAEAQSEFPESELSEEGQTYVI
jgi:ribonuclease Z